MEIKLSYNLLVFLNAYLRQIDLSLDRSRWGGIDDLKEYYKTRIMPCKVAACLLKEAGLKNPEKYPVYFPAEIGFYTRRMLALYYHYVRRKHFLKEAAIRHCCRLLSDFQEVLTGKGGPYTLKEERLRMNVLFFQELIESKLLYRDIMLTEPVEHYLQHKEMTPIATFARDLDLS